VPLRPEIEGGIALPYCTFGTDVLIEILHRLEQARSQKGLGWRWKSPSRPEINGVEIHERTRRRLVALSKRLSGGLAYVLTEDSKALLYRLGLAILAIDYFEQEIGSPHYLIRECLTSEALMIRTWDLPRDEFECTIALRTLREILPVSVPVVFSDGNNECLHFIREVFPEAQHFRYCKSYSGRRRDFGRKN
jgi:hypothetical protein